MGERNKSTPAIILNVKDSGENNRTVTALSPEYGIFYLVLFGGPKSKLRAYVQTFNSGILYFYEDQVKNSRKISDFDVKNSHITFRTDIYKTCAANLASELILKTRTAGDAASSFKYLSAFLDGIDSCDLKESQLGTIRFLWRYLCLLGVNPEIHTCSSCNSSLLNAEEAFYFEKENSFLCPDCVYSLTDSDLKTAKEYFLDKDAVTYLAAISDLSPSQVRALTISEHSYNLLKNMNFHLIGKACGTKLISLESGIGIL